jgi:hypothetical protein
MAGSVMFVTSQVQQQNKQCFNVCVNMPEVLGLNCFFSSYSLSLTLSLSLSLYVRVLAYSLSTSLRGMWVPRPTDLGCSYRNQSRRFGMSETNILVFTSNSSTVQLQRYSREATLCKLLLCLLLCNQIDHQLVG